MADKAIDEPLLVALQIPRHRQVTTSPGLAVSVDLGEAVFLACLILVARIFYLYHLILVVEFTAQIAAMARRAIIQSLTRMCALVYVL